MYAYVDTLTGPARPSARRAASRNELALISLCCALVLPLALCRALLASVAAPSDHLEAALGLLLSVACAPAGVIAVITGHRALLRARHLPTAHARHRMAWSGLVGGYLCVALIFGLRVLPALVMEGQPMRASVPTRVILRVAPSVSTPARGVTSYLPRRAPIGDGDGRQTAACDPARGDWRCWHARPLVLSDAGISLRLNGFAARAWEASVSGHFASPREGHIR